ncbi:hypothetical protein AKJ16_DCAP20422 [Drosera capensis]
MSYQQDKALAALQKSPRNKFNNKLHGQEWTFYADKGQVTNHCSHHDGKEIGPIRGLFQTQQATHWDSLTLESNSKYLGINRFQIEEVSVVHGFIHIHHYSSMPGICRVSRPLFQIYGKMRDALPTSACSYLYSGFRIQDSGTHSCVSNMNNFLGPRRNK